MDGLLDLLEQVRVLPRNHVFQPSRVVPLESVSQADARLYADVSKMVARERNVIANVLPHSGHKVRYQLGAFGRELDAGKHVLHSIAAADGHAFRTCDGAGNVLQQVDAKVHLEPGESLLFALLKALPVDLRILRLGGVGVAADLVA